MAMKGQNLSPHYKEKTEGQGVGLPFYRVAAMLLAACCAFRRKRDYFHQKNENSVSVARGKGTTAAGANSATASGTSQEDGAEGRDKQQRGAEAGVGTPKAWPPLCPSPGGSRYTARPRKDGHNLA